MCNDCPICMEPLFPKTSNILRLKKKVLVKRGQKLPITKLKCCHMYHNKCIKDWFKKTEVESSTKCPMCRNKIIFKPDSKDLMMHKIRHNNPNYEYKDKPGYGRPRYVFRFPTLESTQGEREIDDDIQSFIQSIENSDDMRSFRQSIENLDSSELIQMLETMGDYDTDTDTEDDEIGELDWGRELVSYADIYENNMSEFDV